MNTKASTTYLSINFNKQWNLHVPSSYYQRTSQKKALVKVGAEGRGQKVNLCIRPPATDDYVTKIKLMNKNGSIHVGPFIGILTVKRGSDFKGNKQNFIDIMNTASQLGAFVYVFTIEDIHWDDMTTKGFIYHVPKKEWIHLTNLPLPNVVYNRIPYREDEQQNYVQTALKRLKSIPELYLYNAHFFNKWHLYDALSKNSSVAHHIPESRLLRSREDLKLLALKHPLLYLKPIGGKAGKGIMSIKRKANSYILKVPSKGTIVSRSYSTLSSLWTYLKQRLSEDYVIQQGVELLKHENRPFDIRVLVQKDGDGLWNLTGVGIRVAGENGITTHVPRGGSIASPDGVLIPIFGKEKYEELMNHLRKSVLQIAHVLNHHYSLLGEMSMDIGLTKEGKFWFFEANAKPMKFDEPQIRSTSLKRIIQYAQYLSNFTLKGETQLASQTDIS